MASRHASWWWLGVLPYLAACGPRPVELGFWFEPVAFASPRIGGPMSPAELKVVEAVARQEIAKAFQHLDLTLTDRPNARYRIQVVQNLRDLRSKREVHVAGEARGAHGFGGAGAVNFNFIAGGAMVYSPDTADRAAIIEAIGRGIGRVAVHEFAHQLLPRTDIHASRDLRSYEGSSAATPEQYFGEMHWDIAGPLLEARINRR